MPNLENSQAQDTVQAGMVANKTATEQVGAGGMYTVECVGADGQVKWTDTFHNLVVNQGVQDMNAQYFKGAAYTAAFFLGLVTGPGSGTTFAAGDTLASHAGWTESAAYAGSRKAVTFGTATTANPSVTTNSASPSSFVMNATVTIGGAFLCTVASGSSGVLFSAGDFTGGDKFVDSGDTLNVTYTFSLTAT
jgi:hypothetical protein